MLIACQSVDVNFERGRSKTCLSQHQNRAYNTLYHGRLSIEYSCGKMSNPRGNYANLSNSFNNFCSVAFTVFLFNVGFLQTCLSFVGAKVLLIASILMLSCGSLCCTNCANRQKSNFQRCTICLATMILPHSCVLALFALISSKRLTKWMNPNRNSSCDIVSVSAQTRFHFRGLKWIAQQMEYPPEDGQLNAFTNWEANHFFSTLTIS